MADAFRDDLGIDVHIVTLTDEAAPIEVQSHHTYEERGVGVDARTGGLLVVLNPRLAEARIEVSRSLEHALTDLHMSRIARDQLAPYTSYAAAGMAAMDVLRYLREHVQLSAAIGDLQLPEDLRAKSEYVLYRRFVSSGAGAKTALSSLPLDADLKRPEQADRRRVRHEQVEGTGRPAGELIAQPLAEGAVRVEANHVPQIAMDVLVVLGPRALARAAPRRDPVHVLDDPLHGLLRFQILGGGGERLDLL